MRGLIGETWRLLRTHGPAMLLVALVLLVPAELAVAYASEDSESLGIAAAAGLSFVGYAWVYGALIATISRRARSPLEPYGRTVDRVPVLVLASFVMFFLAPVIGLPALLLSELTDPTWLDGLGNALFGVVLNLPTAALACAVYRQARAVPDAPAASH